MVHGGPLRGTGASTPLTSGSDTSHILTWESIPAIADCRLQGTAGSPTGAALQRAAQLLYLKEPLFATANFTLYKSEKYGIITERSSNGRIKYGPVAQLGERSVRIREVESSSLFRSTTSRLAFASLLFYIYCQLDHVFPVFPTFCAEVLKLVKGHVKLCFLHIITVDVDRFNELRDYHFLRGKSAVVVKAGP